jgi:diadenosine tetraphosphate (Ap4A) HIT family hydrolase
MQRRIGCCLCGQIAGRQEDDLIARMLPGEPYVRRIMMESRSFAVVPSLGPLVPGHCLLLPKSHVTSFARLAGELDAEYQQVKAELKEGLRARFGSEATLFEHGMDAAGDRVLCSVDHAHMHFLPLPHALEPAMAQRREEDWVEVDGRLGTLRDASRGREYVYYETQDGVRRLATRERPFESQYMRQVLAARVGRAERWNWREAPDPRAADRTWREFRAGADR